MRLSRFLPLFLLVVPLLHSLGSLAQTSCSHCGNIVFQENKNQWHENVLFKADFHGGSVFLESDGLTYSVLDLEDLNRVRHDHHKRIDNIFDFDPFIDGHAYRMKWVGSNPLPQADGINERPEYYNYFLGRDQSKWASRVRGFEGVYYTDLYEGIDLRLTSSHGLLKYDLIVETGADPSQIKAEYLGLDLLSVSAGNLILHTSIGEVVEQAPYAYQLINGKEVEVACQYILRGNEVVYDFPEGYDSAYDLVIDPTIIFSTFSGSFADNFGYTATYDDAGNLYSGGSVFGNGYPTTNGAFQDMWAGGTGQGAIPGSDFGISKYAADGSVHLYSTYIGGSFDELPHSLIVNSKNQLFIFGTTSSPDFPTTDLAYDTSYNGGPSSGALVGLGVNYINGSDITVTRLNTDGTQLVASTFVGGTGNDGLNVSPNVLKYNYADEVRGEIIIDENDNVYIVSTTSSNDFPVSTPAFQNMYEGGLDGCIVKMDNNLTTIVWASYLGGDDDDAIYSIALDKNDNLYVSGGTESGDFPFTVGAVQTSNAGGRCDGFVTHINKSGTAILESTFYGSAEYDQSYFVEVDGDGFVYLLGQTEAPDSTFIYNALYSQPNSGQFVTKMSGTLDTLVWSTVFGNGIGRPDISPTAFLVDVCDKAYISGWGGAVNGFGGTAGLDTTFDAYQGTTDNSDFYLLVIEDDASAISYGSYFGGPLSAEHVDGGTSRFDKNGIIYQSVCAGCGSNSDFPIEPPGGPVVSATNNSPNCNNGVFKFDFNLPITLADFDPPPTACAPASVTFNNTSTITGLASYFWDFGDNTTSTQANPSHTYTEAGVYQIMLVSNDPGACNSTDTIIKELVILGGERDTLGDILACETINVQIGLSPSTDTSLTYSWVPTTGLSATDIPNPFAQVNQTTTYNLLVTNGICTDTFQQTILVNLGSFQVSGDTVLCSGDTGSLQVVSQTPVNIISYNWQPANQIVSGGNTANPMVTATDTTTFTVTMESDLGCTYIEIYTLPVFRDGLGVAGVPSAVCIGDSTQLFAVNSNPSDELSYSWEPSSLIYADAGTFNPKVFTTSTTPFVVTAQNAYGCIFKDTAIITVLSDSAYSLPDIVKCDTDPVQIGFNYTDLNISYFWTPVNTLVGSNTAGPLSTTTVPETYTLIMSLGNCADTVTQSVLPEINDVTALGVSLICVGDTIALSATEDDPSIPLTFSWTPTDLIIQGQNQANALAVAPQSTTFVVTASSASGCEYVDSVSVTVVGFNTAVTATANPDTILIGEFSQLMASGAGSVVWTPNATLDNPNIIDPIATPELTTTYRVALTDSNGCEATDTVQVVVLDEVSDCGDPYIYLPNAFTPNDDGRNDVLFVRGNNITDLYLAVYDRWGQMVFETKDQSIGWDGTFKNEALDPAVFGYYMEVICDDEERLFQKGNVTILK